MAHAAVSELVFLHFGLCLSVSAVAFAMLLLGANHFIVWLGAYIGTMDYGWLTESAVFLDVLVFLLSFIAAWFLWGVLSSLVHGSSEAFLHRNLLWWVFVGHGYCCPCGLLGRP